MEFMNNNEQFMRKPTTYFSEVTYGGDFGAKRHSKHR